MGLMIRLLRGRAIVGSPNHWSRCIQATPLDQNLGCLDAQAPRRPLVSSQSPHFSPSPSPLEPTVNHSHALLLHFLPYPLRRPSPLHFATNVSCVVDEPSVPPAGDGMGTDGAEGDGGTGGKRALSTPAPSAPWSHPSPPELLPPSTFFRTMPSAHMLPPLFPLPLLSPLSPSSHPATTDPF